MNLGNLPRPAKLVVVAPVIAVAQIDYYLPLPVTVALLKLFVRLMQRIAASRELGVGRLERSRDCFETLLQPSAECIFAKARNS